MHVFQSKLPRLPCTERHFLFLILKMPDSAHLSWLLGNRASGNRAIKHPSIPAAEQPSNQASTQPSIPTSRQSRNQAAKHLGIQATERTTQKPAILRPPVFCYGFQCFVMCSSYFLDARKSSRFFCHVSTSIFSGARLPIGFSITSLMFSSYSATFLGPSPISL